jgi:hypothetical protein
MHTGAVFPTILVLALLWWHECGTMELAVYILLRVLWPVWFPL